MQCSIWRAGLAICIFATGCKDLLGTDEYTPPGAPHVLPTSTQNAGFTATPSNAHLTYHGGPLLERVRVVPVFWGSSVLHQGEISSFYSAIVGGPYTSWLSEYNASGMAIATGSVASSVVLSRAASSTLSDDDIAKGLDSAIGSGDLPAPTGDTLYMVYFPPGTQVTAGNEGFCSTFCGYHNAFKSSSGQVVYYGVMPDSSSCGSCGSGDFNWLTSVSSHELVEAITDPGVYGNPAWLDDANKDSTGGEIGDLCAWQFAQVSGYTVQREWSNAHNSCIAQGASSTTCGDGTCDATSENCSTCPQDCGPCQSGPVCGNHVCEAGESCQSCPGDCGACSGGAVCGNGRCESGESCSTCSQDCGQCQTCASEPMTFFDTRSSYVAASYTCGANIAEYPVAQICDSQYGCAWFTGSIQMAVALNATHTVTTQCCYYDNLVCSAHSTICNGVPCDCYDIKSGSVVADSCAPKTYVACP